MFDLQPSENGGAKSVYKVCLYSILNGHFSSLFYLFFSSFVNTNCVNIKELLACFDSVPYFFLSQKKKKINKKSHEYIIKVIAQDMNQNFGTCDFSFCLKLSV